MNREANVRVSRTAQYVALYRALETMGRAQETTEAPLFRDPFAKLFLSPGLRLALRATRVGPLRRQLLRYSERRAPGARTSAIGRTVFIDATLRAEIARGTRQLVILGAGYDCRAHRMPELADTTVFEIDRAEMQARKRARLARAKTRVRDDVRYVPVDFLRDDPAERLAASGWDRTKPTVFLWEGVTNYLTEQAVSAVLGWVGASAPGSALVFTYIHAGLLDGTTAFTGGQTLVESVRKLGEPWLFGLRPEAVGAFVARFGLTLREDLGANEYRARCFGARSGGDGYAFYRLAITDVSAGQ